jgi:zinc protease
MKLRILALLVAVCVQSVPLAAQQRGRTRPTAAPAQAATRFDPERFRIKHQKFVLDNGLTLLVHEDHSVPLVAVNVWYHVGSRNERRGKTGFAHLFEHFFFNGSENYPHGFREAMDDLGANNRNGTTNTDRTNFFEDVPTSALERTLYLEADRMGFLAGHISKEMLERERGVVQNEKRQGENQPYGRVFTEIVGRIYPASHPYSWSTIGSMEDLNAASLDDIKEWYRSYYGPNNAVLSLAGDITPQRALELVNKYFGGIQPVAPLTRTARWVPRLEHNMRDQMEDRVPQARIYRVYHAPAWGDPETDQLGLFANVLAGSKSARLTRRLVYEKELVTGVGAGVNDSELTGTFIITATVKPGVEPATVEREMDATVRELVEQGPTAEELRRAQSRTLADFVRGAEALGGFGGRSDILAESMTYGGDPEAYLKRLATTANASPTEVRAAAKKWLDQPHYTMLVKPYPKLAAAESRLDRKQLPALGGAPEVSFPAVQRAELKNGLKVLLLERHTTPLVQMALAVDAGYASDPAQKAGTASLALALMDEGTKTRDAFQIVDALDALGARVFTRSTLDLSLVHMQALPANLRPALDLFADVVLNPAFPPEMFVIQQKRRLAQIGQEKAQPNTVALRVLPKLLYGSTHAYANPFSGSGDERTVAALTREDLRSWHAQWFRPNNSTLVVTGDVKLAELLPQLEQAFGAWPRGAVPTKQLAAAPRTAGRKVYLLDKPDAAQSVIVAAHVSEPGGQTEDIAIETVLRNFGGMSTSRLNRNLRLDKHWSYGTSGQLMQARGQRPFVVVAPVQTDKTKEAMVEVAKELRGVAGERPLAGEEYASIMRNMTLRLPGRFETLDDLENAALTQLNYGLPTDYWAHYAEHVRALSEPQLAAAARKFVRPEEVIWIVVGDLQKVEKGIRELNYGEVVRLNPDGEPMP